MPKQCSLNWNKGGGGCKVQTFSKASKMMHIYMYVCSMYVHVPLVDIQMAAAVRANNTEQVRRFINNLWHHQQKTEFCDFTLTTNNSSIECHKLVLSSASSYFTQLFCGPEQNINIIDVSPLPLQILKTVVAFMYNSDYVIDDENVIELLKFSGNWDLDILARLCVAYMIDNVSINNACTFYNFASDNVDQNESLLLNEFIREHFQSLHDSDQLHELSLKNFTNIIEHDEIDVDNEDVIFSSAVRIIDQQNCIEDINRCLALIRFPHASDDFLLDVVLGHPLMKDPPRNRYAREALRYQLNRKSTTEVKPRRQWQRGIYYISEDQCLYQYVSKAGNDECIKVMGVPELVDSNSTVTLHRKRLVIVGGTGDRGRHGMLLDLTDNTNVKLPNLPLPVESAGVVLTDDAVYVIGGWRNNSGVRSVYYLSLGADTWKTMKPMSHAVYWSLVIQHQHYIYVLGGSDSRNEQSVSQYNMEDDIWKSCSDMPVACRSYGTGVVVHDSKIKVITKDRCLVYADDTDTWTVQQYNELGSAVNAFIKGGQIWAAVDKYNNGTYSIMSYDHVKNEWKTEKEKIKNSLGTSYFC